MLLFCKIQSHMINYHCCTRYTQYNTDPHGGSNVQFLENSFREVLLQLYGNL